MPFGIRRPLDVLKNLLFLRWSTYELTQFSLVSLVVAPKKKKPFLLVSVWDNRLPQIGKRFHLFSFSSILHTNQFSFRVLFDLILESYQFDLWKLGFAYLLCISLLLDSRTYDFWCSMLLQVRECTRVYVSHFGCPCLIFLKMATEKPITTETVALTEKKMDMSLGVFMLFTHTKMYPFFDL